MFIGSKLIPQQSNFWRLSAGTALIASALAGCGGGDGGGGTPATLSGAVIDGYISGATVCLDLNANQTCDSGEPKAQSGANGAYTLDISGISMDALKAAHLFTDVPTTAKDSDDSGNTLEVAGKAPFSLLAPLAAYVNADNSLGKAVISPLTTLVSHDMIVNEKPLAGAQRAVRYALGLSDMVDLSQDFVANKETALHQQAQVIAAALGQAQVAIKTTDISSRDAFFAALTYVQENVKELKTGLASNESVANQIKAKMKSASLSPDSSYLLTEARKSTQSAPASSVTALLSEGVYLADLLEGLTPRYTKASVTNGKIHIKGFELSASGWTERSEDGDPEFALTAQGWTEDDGCSGASIQDNGKGKASLSCPDNSTATMSVRTLDIEGKSLAELGERTPEEFRTFKFPKGSNIHQAVITNLTDEYQIWGETDLGKNGQTVSTIQALMNVFQTKGQSRLYWADGVRPSITFDATGSTVTLWPHCTAAGNTTCTLALGQAAYEIKTVHGQELLIVKIQPEGEAPGNYLLFASYNGKVRSGVYRPANTGSVTDFFLNKTAMNALLKQAKRPEIQ